MEDERRLIGRVLRHWTKTVHARGFPRHDEIDPWMLGDDWENCLLIAVAEPVELSHFVSVGKNLTVALCSGTSLVGVFMSHLPRVLSERRCLIVEGGATLAACEFSTAARFCRYPRMGSRSVTSSARRAIAHWRLKRPGRPGSQKRDGFSLGHIKANAAYPAALSRRTAIVIEPLLSPGLGGEDCPQ
jgi:hypothetical protein